MSTMMVNNMFYNGQPQSSAASGARSVFINPVKTFCKTWQMFFVYSLSIIANMDTTKRLLRGNGVFSLRL